LTDIVGEELRDDFFAQSSIVAGIVRLRYIRVQSLSPATEPSLRDKLNKIKAWYERKGPTVLVIGYEMFRNLTLEPQPLKKEKDGKLSKGKQELKDKLEDLRYYLTDPGPDIVVCDEAHRLKSQGKSNRKTRTVEAMNQLRTKWRIALTGTPLQNNLYEYYSMVDFVKVGLRVIRL
jgi:SNF2 family DNA or RNA helicase